MYRKLLTALFALLFLFIGRAQAFEFPIKITEYLDDVRVIAYINKSDINEKLQWTPFGRPPPLSIYGALIAIESYIKDNDDFTNIKLTGIELKQMPHHDLYWHYLVKAKYGPEGEMQSHFFVVLMDGKVIAALKQPESIK